MDQEEINKAQNHIKKHLDKCPCCGNNSWAIQDELVITPNFDTKARRPSLNSGIPFVVAVCDNCYYSIFFQAKYIGIV